MKFTYGDMRLSVIRHMEYELFFWRGYELYMTKQSDLNEDDLRLLEASYRLVADARAFDDVISHWARRLDQADKKTPSAVDQPMLLWHMQTVSEMLEKLGENQAADPIEQAIN